VASSMASANVLLLRAPQYPDRYESAFQASGYAVSSVPVLETALTNLLDLERIVKAGPRFTGVIITSARACEAWMSAVEGLKHEREMKESSSWTSTPFYVVGNTTATALGEIHSRYPNSPFAPIDIRGQSSGTSEQLAHFILDDMQQTSAKLLYLTGDKNRDTLSKILEEGQVELEPLKVYETRGSSSFTQDLQDALASLPTESPESWIVFFAPSAAEYVMPHLRKHFNFDLTSSPRPARVAAIGPTTSLFLQEKLGLRVDAVAAKPSPEDLLAALKAAIFP